MAGMLTSSRVLVSCVIPKRTSSLCTRRRVKPHSRGLTGLTPGKIDILATGLGTARHDVDRSYFPDIYDPRSRVRIRSRIV